MSGQFEIATHQDLFRHITADNAALYRCVLDVCAAAERQLLLYVRPSEILTQAKWPGEPPTASELDAILDKLTEWGNLDCQADNSRVTSLSGFYRRRMLYRLAADLNQALSDIRDNEWDGLQSKIYSEYVDLQNALAQLGYVPDSKNVDGFGLVVTIAVQNKSGLSPAQVLTQVDTEITQRRTLLTESETKILEDHLQSEMSVQIRNLIQDAEQYVERVNAEIEKRPTSTGTYFRLRWIPLTEAQGAGAADVEP